MTKSKTSFARWMLTFVAALTMWFGARVAHAEPVRILVAAGSTLGLEGERPLKFPVQDATRVRDVMVRLGGVKPEHGFVVGEPSPAQLFASLERAQEEARKHRPEEVTLIFYFSGHGDREALHLAGTRVLLSQLSAKLAEIPAGLRIAVTDACRATREKGFTAEEPFAVTAANVPQAKGQVWLHASSDGEAAQESDELEGALFTHAWLNGLRGAADTNGDARVTLEESFAFAHAQTLVRSAKSSGVLQKPEAILTLRETAPVVLTQRTAQTATLVFPRARDVHFIVYLANAKSVMSEMWSAHDRRLGLAIPAGHYVVHRRAGGMGSTARIALAEGEERGLTERDFTPSTGERLARKGRESIETSAARRETKHELSVGYDSGWNSRTGFAHGPQLTYSYAWSTIALSLGAVASFSDRTVAEKKEHLTAGYGRASVEARLRTRAFTWRAGAGGRAGIVSQTLEGAEGYLMAHPTQTDRAFAIGPEAFLAGRAPLGTWFVDVGAVGAWIFLREESVVRGILSVTGAVSLGAGF